MNEQTLEELEHNSKYRSQALEPMIDELKKLNQQTGELISAMIASSRNIQELLVEIIKRLK